MINILLLLLAVTSSHFSVPPMEVLEEQLDAHSKVISVLPSIYLQSQQLEEIKDMLLRETSHLNAPVIDKVITTLECATAYNVERNNILTIIDYSLPSNAKRLWVFDLQAKQLLFHTYVSHGITSGALLTNFFSNKYNSKASSIGVYKTDKAYYGREGLSLRLNGLDRNFNDNASNRYIVMHGGWYVDENFIKRYGRPGRSWGCPALPLGLYQPIINTIKENSWMVIYYPNDDWFVKSKFLTCESKAMVNTKLFSTETKLQPDSDSRESILFVDFNHNNNHEDGEPVVAMSADNYERIFHAQAPLERMIRRQINNAEYVAVSTTEFNKLVMQNDKEALNAINFVIPNIIMVHGYYETQMKILNMGAIKEIHLNTVASSKQNNLSGSYFVSFVSKPQLNLKPTSQFIRWVGL